MDILKDSRKLILTVLALVTVITSALVGDLTSQAMVDAVVKIIIGFFGANSLEHISTVLKRK